MGSIRLNIKSGRDLHWPPLCAVCSREATDTVKSSITLTEEPRYYVVALGWTKKKYSIQFPVCHKHKLLCKLLDLPASMGFIDSFLFLILVPGFIWLALLLFISFIISPILSLIIPSIKEPIDAVDINKWLGVTIGIIYAASVGFFIIAGILKPVKISALNETSLNLQIKNINILKVFKLLNAEKIVN